MMGPNGLKMFNSSGSVIFLGRFVMYKLVCLMSSEGGRAKDTMEKKHKHS